jgi:hypothetical protein
MLSELKRRIEMDKGNEHKKDVLGDVDEIAEETNEETEKKMNSTEMKDVDEKRKAAKPAPKRGRKPVSKSLTMSDLPAIPPRGETLDR